LNAVQVELLMVLLKTP